MLGQISVRDRLCFGPTPNCQGWEVEDGAEDFAAAAADAANCGEDCKRASCGRQMVGRWDMGQASGPALIAACIAAGRGLVAGVPTLSRSGRLVPLPLVERPLVFGCHSGGRGC